MIVTHPKVFVRGLIMALGFLATLGVMFTHIFGKNGKGEPMNAFNASDALFNSIAKGSSYYIPKLRAETAEKANGAPLDVTLKLKDPALAKKARTTLTLGGAAVTGDGADLKVKGDLGVILAGALNDSDAMFQGRGPEVATKHGYPEKEVMFVWWTALKEATKALKAQKNFKDMATIEEVMLKGVEVGYNFYGIEARKASANALLLAGTLLFYIFYTMWWGYAVLFLFDGLGLQMKAHAKKEV